ncbi:hypothetical protein MYX84_00695 [Acidobacteria bacterium AH-259-O06]|nr:hypothetical protein [Acidobacteria bacterium AH-259-O06]
MSIAVEIKWKELEELPQASGANFKGLMTLMEEAGQDVRCLVITRSLQPFEPGWATLKRRKFRLDC